jgi:hypothetical protein
VDVKMITGDQVLIAKEMSRILGLGLNISDAHGLPSLDAEGKIPKDLHLYTRKIVQADGFAQVYPEHKVGKRGWAVGLAQAGQGGAKGVIEVCKWLLVWLPMHPGAVRLNSCISHKAEAAQHKQCMVWILLACLCTHT